MKNLLGKAHDAAFWQDVREKNCYRTWREELLQLYRKECESDTIPDLRYSAYKLYWVTGDRGIYEGHYFARRRALSAAALLSLLYPEEASYLEKAQDLLFCVCNEYSWCLPAHQGALDTVDSTRIDLFAAETGFALSEIYTLLGERLDPLIRGRILHELDRRMFNPFLEKEPYRDAFWEGAPHNWASVCMGSVACAMMLIRPENAKGCIPRFERTMTTYLGGLSDDGICSEGVGYWHYGFGFFTVYADLVRTFTDGEVDWFKNDKVKRVAAFMQKMYLSGMATVSYADGSRANRYHLGLLHRLKAEYPDDILVYSPEYSYNYAGCARFCLHLRAATWLDEQLYNDPSPIDAEMTYYAPSLQWMIVKRATYGFSAKGGSNAELHNHNDVGSFIFAKDGVQCLCDIGSGAYTRQYFDSKLRYTILECSSRSHSVPLIGGCEQVVSGAGHLQALQESEQYVGGAAHTRDVVYADGVLSMDIALAYRAAGLDKLQRTFDCADDCVTLTDEVIYTGQDSVVERLVSLFEPIALDDHTLRVGTATVTFDPALCDYALHSEPLTTTGAPCYMMDFILKAGVHKVTFMMR
ncbi:MAG: heparinase II/III family protein [Clostridia bacterium]|nr:heparinase II/III family protein [Clostridia bacterium]